MTGIIMLNIKQKIRSFFDFLSSDWGASKRKAKEEAWLARFPKRMSRSELIAAIKETHPSSPRSHISNARRDILGCLGFSPYVYPYDSGLFLEQKLKELEDSYAK